MKITLIITLLVSSMFVACGKWQQDPLAGKSGVAGAGTQNPTLPIIPKPTPVDAIRIDAEEFHVFKENTADKIEVSGRVLEAGYTLTLEIANKASFPGSTFNGKEFSWSPPTGTVTAADDQVKIMPLVIRATAQKPGVPVLVREQTVTIQIKRVFKTPTVISITQISDTVREGETNEATVLVEDADANMAVPATWPTLQFGGMLGKSSLANFMKMGTSKSIGNNRYEIKASIDLTTEPELTASKGDYGYSVFAISRFQVTGMPQTKGITVLTSFTAPVSTWAKPVDAAIGTKFSYQFLIMDPKSETRLDRNVVFAGAPAGAVPACTSVSDSVLSCVLTWDVPATQTASTVSFTGTVKYGNVYTLDTASKSSILSFQVAPVVRGGQ